MLKLAIPKYTLYFVESEMIDVEIITLIIGFSKKIVSGDNE